MIVVDYVELEAKANWIRRTVLEKVAETGKGHLGGTFSCVEILTALYYGGGLRGYNFDPKNPKDPERDRLLIGKGHCCLAVYVILMDLGLITKETFDSYGKDGGLGGQLDTSIPGVECNTGSLGHVLGIGVGLALAAKMDGSNRKTFVLMGDAECQEGSVWEAMAFAAERKLDNLIAIVDCNGLSVTDRVKSISVDKVHAFGWGCSMVDGHRLDLLSFYLADFGKESPMMILAMTVKGKGVSFMEDDPKWHHGGLTAEQLAVARMELGSGVVSLDGDES